jgi:hypothetical protein
MYYLYLYMGRILNVVWVKVGTQQPVYVVDSYYG